MEKQLITQKNKIGLHQYFRLMPDGWLFVYFLASIPPASYWAYVVSQLYAPYIDAFNEAGFTLMGLLMSAIMVALVFKAWFFSCVTKCTGSLIYERFIK
ncbi:MAG: hypothetical protein DSZ28_01690 [Thiothrix sp.]|nr:MAG: hypothetical protein DSZ28_01690 [Thiothrix sp.]